MRTLKEKKVTAAIKEHVCSFCGLRIPKGDSYFRSTHIDDSVYDWKSHVHCEKIANQLNMYEASDNFLTSEIFRDIISEEYNDLMFKLVYDSGITSNNDIIMQQFDNVVFRQKLGHVIRHHNKPKQP